MARRPRDYSPEMTARLAKIMSPEFPYNWPQNLDPRRAWIFERLFREGREHRAWKSLHEPMCMARTWEGYCIRRGRVLGAGGRCPTHGGKSTGPRTPEGRRAVGEAQKRRWAAWRAAGSPPPTPEASANMSEGALRRWAPRRREKERQARHRQRMAALGFTPSGRKYQISPEGREAIAAAQRRRWDKWRAERRQT